MKDVHSGKLDYLQAKILSSELERERKKKKAKQKIRVESDY